MAFAGRPVPTVAPAVSGGADGLTAVKLTIRDPRSPDRRARPAKVRQIAVLTHFGDSAPTDINAWRQPIFSGRTDVRMDFPWLVGETKVWVTCAYVNSRNQFGPASAPVSIRVLGQPASATASEQGDPTLKIAA